jgi:hypothetical protein
MSDPGKKSLLLDVPQHPSAEGQTVGSSGESFAGVVIDPAGGAR